MPNMKNEIKNSNIKFTKNKMDELMDMVMSNSLSNNTLLPVNDRALIYVMYWCTSEHCNLSKYEFDRIIKMAEQVRYFLNK